MTEDLVKRLLDVAAATGPNEARQIALAAADRIKELEDKLVKPFAWITSETSDWLKGYDGPACAKATAIHRVPPKSGTSVPVYSVPPSIRPESEVRAEAWAAAIEAVLGLPKRLEPIGGQMHSYANRGEIHALITDDARAALDRIKADARAEGREAGMREAARICEGYGQPNYICGGNEQAWRILVAIAAGETDNKGDMK